MTRVRIESNALDISRDLDRVLKGLPRTNIDAIKKAQRDGVKIAKTLAPRRRGVLKQNIKRLPVEIKRGRLQGRIVSFVGKSFPYHFWVNQTKDYETINYFKMGVERSYGSMKGKTGTPGYFDKTARILRKKYFMFSIKSNINNFKQFRGKGI